MGKYVQNIFLGIVQGVLSGFAWLINQTLGLLNTVGIISNATFNKAIETVDSIPAAIQKQRDQNNATYDRMISSTNNKIEKSEGGKELAALEAGRQQSVRDRANAMLDSKSASEKAIADAQRELADLMKQQADLAANYKPAEPGQPKSAVQRAIEIQPQKIMSEMKTDVGNSASFNTRIANALAKNSQSRLAEKANQLLEQIVENTGEPNEATYGAGEG